jgi:alkaline phosphatase
MAGQRTWTTASWMALTGIVLGAMIAGVGAVTKVERDHRGRETRGPMAERAKNVLLFVGNGMGDSDIAAARNYLVGADGLLWMEMLSQSSEYPISAPQRSNPFSADVNDDTASSSMLKLARRAGFKTALINSPIAESGSEDPAVLCKENHRPADEPSLAVMTARAIERLNAESGQGQQVRPGFFLQVDGFPARTHDRAGNLCQRIGEIVAFNRAIGVALKFAENEPDTLVLVTADRSRAVPSADASHPQGEPASTFRIAAQGPGDALVVGTANTAGPFHAIARTLSLE